MRFLLVSEGWRSSVIDPILFTFVFSASYTLKSMLNNAFFVVSYGWVPLKPNLCVVF